MKAIKKPTFKVKIVFTECISTVDDIKLKKNLTMCTDLLEKGEEDFESKFNTFEIYKIIPNPIVLGKIGEDEMKKVYNYRMRTKKMPGHKYYNQIILSAKFGKCPQCSIRTVDALDHYLPKSKFPLYAVTPINLIPSCSPCNKGKLIGYPKTSEEQTLHPYYDNIESESWIEAKVLQTNPIGFEFYVNPPLTASPILKDRVTNHFVSFKLDELFAVHANEELRGSSKQFINLYNNDPDLLTAHLKESYDSRLALGVNSWQAVMYNALWKDVWFCTGGVLI